MKLWDPTDQLLHTPRRVSFRMVAGARFKPSEWLAAELDRQANAGGAPQPMENPLFFYEAVDIRISAVEYAAMMKRGSTEAVPLGCGGSKYDGGPRTYYWWFRNRLVATGTPDATPAEAQAFVLHEEKRESDASARRAAIAAAACRIEQPEPSRSDARHISAAVRRFVWKRDNGACVRCGSRQKLEYDHIIPVADGGSSTARNVELLCETCNRTKGRHVA